LEEMGKGDLLTVGGKGASLGEMYQAGICAPQGFVGTAQTHSRFLEQVGIKEYIRDILVI